MYFTRGQITCVSSGVLESDDTLGQFGWFVREVIGDMPIIDDLPHSRPNKAIRDSGLSPLIDNQSHLRGYKRA